VARGPVELYSDCAHCLLEAGVVELYDPDAAAARFGVPSSVRCRLCGARAKGVVRDAESAIVARDLANVPANACPSCERALDGSAVDERRCKACRATALLEQVDPPATLSSEAELVARLDAWCKVEGLASRESLLESHFSEPSIAQILACIAARQPIATPIDPFALGGARLASSNASLPAAEEPASAPRSAPPPSAPPRAVVYPLVSVIVADGEVHASERDVVNRFLTSEGLEPLRADELVVHRAEDVARFVPRDKREKVIELMCETACADGIPDASEVRVIRAYAAAWDVPEDKLSLWLWGHEQAAASGARQLWLKIRRFLLSSRWEDQDA
jgi:uncharacterized tellurite resistance protein B-like protein